MKIIHEIDRYITDPFVIDKRGRFAHYPSEAKAISRVDGEIIGKCHRATWYDWMGYEPTNPVDARGRWIFLMGKLIEGGYVEYCKQLGIWAGNNIHMYDQVHNISGEADLFIFNEQREIEGVEIKTAYGRKFQKEIKVFPKLDNLLQVALYLEYFKMPWHLIYKARDTQEDVEYIINLDSSTPDKFLYVDGNPCHLFYLEDIYTQYKVLGEYVINKKIPPRDYTYMYSMEESEKRLAEGKITKNRMVTVKNGKGTDSDWNCLYCGHLDRCWVEKRATLELKQPIEGQDEI